MLPNTYYFSRFADSSGILASMDSSRAEHVLGRRMTSFAEAVKRTLGDDGYEAAAKLT